LEILNRKIPAALYQADCRYTLFEIRCNLNASSYAVESVATTGSDLLTLNCGLAQASGYFTLGDVQFFTGPNTGARRTIRAYEPGLIILAAPLLHVPEEDEFTAWPGCNKQEETCREKYANFLADGVTPRFCGEKNIPKPEAAF
jgi:uncharacterized phage protein (TIGR02218 family)